jgi:peptidoglycan hydrolase-like protein with peptidoglycan-binding domain
MAGEPTLRRGSRGPDVVKLQQQLSAAGFNPGAADGIFGAKTDAAVRAFQTARGLAVDGIVGPKTWAALASGGQPSGQGGRGVSIHIGLNAVDPDQYGGWDGALGACEFDANDMRDIAVAQGFTPQVFLTTAATSQAVVAAIQSVASSVSSGDTVLLTYSGHGGQVPDVTGEETDSQDETWVLYDRQLLDDELYQLWAGFPAGVRIAVLSDSCHSGTVTRAMRERGDIPADAKGRAMPEEVEQQTYAAHKDLYDGINKSIPNDIKAQVKATIVLVSGCQDDQTSLDGDRNGAFTGALRQVWSNGSFSGNWREFQQQIRSKLPATQQPNYTVEGQQNAAFESSRPFSH